LRGWLPGAVAATLVATMVAMLQVACSSSALRREQPPHPVQSGSIEQYAAAIKANAQRSDHESDSRVRADLAAQSSSEADACLALDDHSAACQYGKALATGLEARAHPARAVGLLSSMLQSLHDAESADPGYDKAGPSRVRALVLIRAPAWPIGPGDADAGLAAARRAVSLQPDYPANVLALAEALSRTGDASGARENYARARELAQSLPSGPERDDWLRDAEAGLNRK
jgi:tetratricopeptide (TPR) repeat protein